MTIAIGLPAYFVNQNSGNDGIAIHIEGSNYGDISANQILNLPNSERNQSQILIALQSRINDLQNQIETLQKESEENNQKQILRLEDEIKLHEQAIKAFNEGNFNLALVYFKDLETRYENDDNIKNAIGSTIGALGDHQTAIQYFNSALELNPNNDLALQNRAWAQLQLNKLDEAKKDFEDFLKIPTVIAIYLDPILPLLHKYEFDSLALAYQERILQERPDDVIILEDKARIHHKLNDLDNAKKTLERILEIDKKNVKALFYLGVIHAQLKQFDDALTYIDAALEIEPNNSDIIKIRNFIANRSTDDLTFNFGY